VGKRGRKRKRASHAASATDPRRAQRTPSEHGLGWLVALVAAVLAAYSPALEGGFVWDDDAHVTGPELRSLAGLWRIWTDLGATQQYYPLLHSAFWLEHRIWGNAVLGYHLVNVVLHAACAWLLLLGLRRLGVSGGLLAAAIFALHPVHVESVAWISEQKNTLSLLLYLGALLVYLRFDDGRRRRDYLLASGLFLLGLLTKTVVATLPGALLVLLWWRRGRLDGRRDVMPLLPWFALAAAAGLLTAWFERRLLGAAGAPFAFTLAERCLLAGRVVWFYAGKLVWPSDLTFIYPRWEVNVPAWPHALYPLAAVAALAAAWAVRRRSRAPLAAALFYVGSLFPALGFVNVYPFVFSFVADHFQYLASLGPISAAACSAFVLLQRQEGARRRVFELACVGLVALLSVLTWRQSHDYRDVRTLYERTLARNPGCYLCLNNLAAFSLAAGDTEVAAARYREVLRLKPDSVEALSNLGNLQLKSGRVQQAIESYESALRIAPNNVVAHTNLGIAFFTVGRVPEAIAQYEAALRIMPDYQPARRSLELARAAAPR
jgi:protein O-mannosyl-transferase